MKRLPYRTIATGSLAFAAGLMVATPSLVAAAPDLAAAFARIDADGDGKVTRSEFMSTTDRLFVRDGAAPGTPTAGARPFVLPLRADAPPPPADMSGKAPPATLLEADFRDQDRNRDDHLSLAEFRAHFEGMMRASFGALDRNRDGAIDAGEFAAGRPVAKGASPLPAPRFEALDDNGDGRIDWAEFYR